MTDAELEAQERRILQAAQRAFSPDDRAADRVLARTLAALAAAPATGTAGEPSAEAPVTTTHASLVASIPTAAKLVLVLAFGAGTGLAGYILGYHNASSDRASQTPTAVPANQKSASVSGSGSASPSHAASRSDAASVSPASTVSSMSTSTSTVSASDSEYVSSKPHRPKPTPTPSPLTADPSSLQLELKALRNIERALRDNQPHGALELLGELDRDVPEGALAEERLAAFQMARCALELGTPSRLSAEFSAQYPNSVYRARVEQTCRNRGPHDTHE